MKNFRMARFLNTEYEKAKIIFLTDNIDDMYKAWRVPDEVYIQTPTGSGKTTFILETLSAFAISEGREILLLVNRKILKNQIKHELAEQHGMEGLRDEEIEKIKDFAGITVMSYQEVQEQLKSNRFLFTLFGERRFFYIVFDEAHYLLQDAQFNRDIAYMLAAIPQITHAVKIFMSATMEDVQPFLQKILDKEKKMLTEIFRSEHCKIMIFRKGHFTEGRVYDFRQKHEFPVDKICYFKELKTFAEKINGDKTEDKWLIFINSKKEAKELQKHLASEIEVGYIDADTDDESETKQNIVKNSRFEEKVLITTKVLDNGINLKDKKLRNIVLMTTERTEFIQMLGRKRFLEGETGINLYLMSRTSRYFQFIRDIKLASLEQFIGKIDCDDRFHQALFDDKDFYDFCQKTVVISNNRMLISPAAREKIRLDKAFCNEMMEKLRLNADAFVLEQLAWIGRESSFSPQHYLESENKEKADGELVLFLQENAGKKLNKDEQHEFRTKFKELTKRCGKKLTDREGRTAGKSIINKFFENEGMPFVIESVNNSKFWILEEESV